MRLDYNLDNYKQITDDTSSLEKDDIFLLTVQNRKYFDQLNSKPSFITPLQLIQLWNLNDLRMVGVTGTNGKTTVTAAIYSFLLD